MSALRHELDLIHSRLAAIEAEATKINGRFDIFAADVRQRFRVLNDPDGRSRTGWPPDSPLRGHGAVKNYSAAPKAPAPGTMLHAAFRHGLKREVDT